MAPDATDAPRSAWTPVTERLERFLRERDARFRIMEHAPVFTSEEAARVRGTPIEAGAKALVFLAGDRPIHVVLPGARRVDNARLRAVLGTRTLRYMTRNHLPGGADLETFGRRLFAETTFDGVGFGLGFAVLLDPVANKVLSTPGELAWGGAASTFFWVDPAEQLTAIFLTQLLPSSTYPLRSELRQLVYQALVD